MIKEYYSNGDIKHKICYYDDGGKDYEQFYDENGKDHRENCLPDYQSWYKNGILFRKTYTVHGNFHNINGPADIRFEENGKIRWNEYYFNNRIKRTKLQWQNQIKNI